MSNNKSNPPARSQLAPTSASEEPGCQAADLKGLLNAIVTQISDADRRHSDTLHQMHDRLSNLGRDASSLRARVPDQFRAAFENIEAGMAELAARIAEAGSAPAHHFAPAQAVHEFAATMPAAMAYPPQHAGDALQQPAPPAHEMASAEEPPVALRSAQQPGNHVPAATRAQKTQTAVDTFDVIESLPGDVSDPWDRDAANALASVYEGEPRTYASDPYAAQMPETPRVYAPPAPPAAPAAPAVDLGWFEKRFAAISERIETSLADIRPDQSFFALGQRLDQFERSFAQAFDSVATRNDVESVRLIEAHMVELVGHLETTQNHLARIDLIEEQLGAIAHRLNEVHALAQASGDIANPESATGVDVAAVARAAAEEAALRFASKMPQPLPQAPPVIEGLDDMRDLIERSMSNARQSEENTTALLDTLQQAMIRLLDRMDAIEFNSARAAAASAQAVSAPSQPHQRAASMNGPEYDGEDFYAEPQLSYGKRDERPDPLDEAVAAVAHKAQPSPMLRPAPAPVAEAEAPRREMRAAPAEHAPAAADARPSEKLRQDFIADARRAKMRLEGEGGKEPIVLAAPAVREAPAAAPKPAAGKVKAPVAATEGKASAVSPRVVALSVALALAGAAYVMLPGKKVNVAGTPPAATQAAAPAAPAVTKQAQGPDTGEAAGKTTGSTAGNGAGAGDAPPPDADFSRPAAAPGGAPAQLNMHRTEGEIVPGDMTVGQAQRPMHGIAVARNDASAEDIARARRDHAMANVSNRLGEAAAQNPAIVSPAAIEMNGAEGIAAGVVPNRAGQSSALDLPPATVGPLSLRLAAANGDSSAEFEVGARLAEGKGTDQNFKDAAKWYQRAASKGFAQAQYRLGTLYERGLGLKADEGRAKEWYLRAAEQGNIKAMHNLAVLSANAKSGTPDYTTAAKWFTDAAERGLADSQFNLAVLYENGLGVDADMRQSYKWLSLAARGGDKEATRRRDIMKGKLSADDLAAAEALMRSYQVRASDPLVNDARTAGEAWKKNPANGENG